jgi:hypothetical protein
MYALFDTDHVTRIDGVLDPALFFGHLPKLLPQDDFVLGLGCYRPDMRVKTWLDTLPPLHIPPQYDHRSNFDLHRKQDPLGGAWYLRPTSSNLAELVRLARLVTEPQFLCVHVIAFRGETSLFSFHDAFCGDEMLVAPGIDEDCVKAFCIALDAKSRTVPYRISM